MKYLVEESKVREFSFDYRHEITKAINQAKAEESGISEEEMDEKIFVRRGSNGNRVTTPSALL